MKEKLFLFLAMAMPLASVALTVKVEQSATGPQLMVNGERRMPRFYYGSPTCLCNISGENKTVLKVPFLALQDSSRGRVEIKGYYGIDPIWFSDVKLVDLAEGTTNAIRSAKDEIRTLNFVTDDLLLKKGHRYHFIFTHRATRPRTYFRIAVSCVDDSGKRISLPYYYGDTLGDTVRIASEEADVDFVTFSTDVSWGSEDWWNPPDKIEDYSKLDREMKRLIAINPKALLVPRVTVDAPIWFLQQHPEARMVYDTGFNLWMSSVSSRPYRAAACEALEKLARHLKETFADNFAGLQICGQNSAEWFYMMSQSSNLSGYDEATRDAFREWLKERGDKDWATAEVPSSAERHSSEKKSGRLLEFARFRQREVASFLLELGSAAKRGSRGEALALFFYGYSWELGAVRAGSSETGHFDLAWLLERAKGKIDGISSPLSYSSRNIEGSTTMMTPAESVMRSGLLWFNEIDHRTHLEEMWDHMATFHPYKDPRITREMFMRDSAADILRGYGDWWMDLFGRGWFRDKDIWKLRNELHKLDKAMFSRKQPYSPKIANVVDEESFIHDGWLPKRYGLLNRKGFGKCGIDYGQYLLADFLKDPPKSVKLVYLTVADNLTAEMQAKLAAYKAKHPDVVCVVPTAEDMSAEAIAKRARAAGITGIAPAGKANVTSAEGYFMVQALGDGELPLDLGLEGEVIDFMTGEKVGMGPRIVLKFRAGETRILRAMGKK